MPACVSRNTALTFSSSAVLNPRKKMREPEEGMQKGVEGEGGGGRGENLRN